MVMRNKFKKWLINHNLDPKATLGVLCIIFGWGALFGVLTLAPSVDLGAVTLLVCLAILWIFWFFGLLGDQPS